MTEEPALRQAVEKLLSQYKDAQSFFVATQDQSPPFPSDRADRLAEGMCLADRCQVVKPIGVGGAGEGYHANDRVLVEVFKAAVESTMVAKLLFGFFGGTAKRLHGFKTGVCQRVASVEILPHKHFCFR